MALPQLSLAFVSLVFATYVLSLFVLRVALRLGHRAWLLAALSQLLWLGAVGWMAGSGYLVSDVAAMPPLLMRAVVLPAVVGVVIVAALPVTGRLLDEARVDWLISAQAFRLPLELLLHGLYLAGALPQRLTFAGANFDICTGIAALVVGYLLHKGRAPRWLLWGFNLLGLTLLFAIVGMFILSIPTPLQVFTDTPEPRLPFHVPFVWLPGYLVPVALLLHLLTIRHLWRTRRAA